MKLSKTRQWTLIISFALMLSYAFLLNNNLLKQADFLIFDLQAKKAAKQLPSDNDIVIITIDDYSLSKMQALAGMWVWPRSVHAQLVDKLNQWPIKAIVFDILFAEQDVYRPDDDLFFNEVLAQNSNIYFAALQQNTYTGSGINTGGVEIKELANLLAMKKSSSAKKNAQASFVLPLAIDSNYWQVGTINFTSDFDGVGRSYDTYRNIDGWLMPSLATKVVEGINEPAPEVNKILLQWRGDSQQPFKTYSYADVYHAVINHNENYLAQFENKIILIGASASGLYDARATAINKNLPGVYMLAMAIDNLKNQGYLETIPYRYSLMLGVVVIFLITVCFLFIQSYLKQLAYALLFMLVTSYGLWLVAQSLLLQQTLMFVGGVISFMAISFLTFSLFYGYLEYQRRLQTITMFDRFLHPQVVRKLLKEQQLSPDKLNKKQVVTVLFSDIRNFTKLSETKPAEQVLQLLNSYFEQQLKVIFEHDGTLDKFIGDCLMAFWGAPVDNPNHAVSSIAAALAMEKALLAFKETLPESLVDFDIGIGIHTGECIVGMIGANSRLDYTVIGDTVNLASRIEGLTKNSHRILVSQRTKELSEHVYDFEFAEEHKVKGRQALVKVYRPIGLKLSSSEDNEGCLL